MTAWPKDGPPLLWEKKVGSGYSGPVIVGNRLILFHRVDDEEIVECLDAADGKERWKFAYATNFADSFGKGNGPRATPAIAGTRVYTLGAAGHLHCLDLATGKKVWDRSLNSEYRVPEGYFGVATSPLVEDDLVLINVGGKQAGIVAFAKDTGKEVWKATTQGASYASPVAATIEGTRHVFFFTRLGIVALDPSNGTVRFEKRWRARIDASVNAASPVVFGDHVFFSSSYNTGAILIRVKKDGFEEVWQNDESLSCHYNTSVYRDGFLYGIDGRQEEGPRLRCVEALTGKVRWSRERFGCTVLLGVEGHLLGLTEDGDLVLLETSPEAFREKARAKILNRTCRAELALADGRLYARDDNKLGCWNVKK